MIRDQTQSRMYSHIQQINFFRVNNMLCYTKKEGVYNDEIDLSELTKFLTKNKGLFEDLLIHSLDHIDHMATNINGIIIKNVSHCDENEFFLEYSYDWHVYRGCSDMNEDGEIDDSISFTLHEDGNIEFHHLETTEHNTIDEF